MARDHAAEAPDQDHHHTLAEAHPLVTEGDEVERVLEETEEEAIVVTAEDQEVQMIERRRVLQSQEVNAGIPDQDQDPNLHPNQGQ